MASSKTGEVLAGATRDGAPAARRRPDREPGSAGDRAVALFRAGRRAEAMPLLQEAADDDARARYLLGVALFNGDHVARDPGRARALLASAAADGVAQATAALAEIDAEKGGASPTMLVSARAAALTAASFARLTPPGGAAAPTLQAMTRELLVPLLRERLEAALPDIVGRAVDRALDAAKAGQANPARS